MTGCLAGISLLLLKYKQGKIPFLNFLVNGMEVNEYEIKLTTEITVIVFIIICEYL